MPAALAATLLALCLLAQGACGGNSAPGALTDDEFSRMVIDFSEPDGPFTHSDNLVSNEIQFADIMRTLRPRGGAYIGVGPEQNFSYIAEVRPAMAFIVDIRAENRSLQLLYKALFEIATDRVDFVSKLFGRPRPPGLGSRPPVNELFEQFAATRAERRLRDETGRLVREQLTTVHRLPLEQPDLAWIDYALDAFFADGPSIHYARLLPHDPPGPSYRTLMTAADTAGDSRSYLASDEDFAFVKDLQSRNLIVPLVGDFGGTKTLRRTAEYLRAHRLVVSAFYSSNVEVYLNRDKSAAFCLNLAMLPRNWNTYFIWSKGKQPLRLKLAACRGLIGPANGGPASQ